MAGTPRASDQPAANNRPTPSGLDATRWYGACDAMAPYLIALIAVAIARQPFDSTVPATVAVVVAALLLAAGAGVPFFWSLPVAHRTWPVACALFVLVSPFLALHLSLEHSALNAPVPFILLPLVFTFGGLIIISLLIAGCLYTMSAEQPGWAGVIVAPIAVLIAAVAATSPDGSRDALLTALLIAFA
ncbi:MAG: hypothetical protein LC793_24900, partial [Thermomicrobia bacterium]|nr:hypothetical protein [Thermomicrobia bacterium]